MTIDLDAIKARAAAATPGPWGTRYGFKRSEVCRIRQGKAASRVAFCHDWTPNPTDADHKIEQVDAEFIAHAREDVPALIAELEAARRVVAAARIPALLVYAPALHEALIAYDALGGPKEGWRE